MPHGEGEGQDGPVGARTTPVLTLRIPRMRRSEPTVIRCPVCDSSLVRLALSAVSGATCVDCGARWVQEGRLQRDVNPFGARRAGREERLAG